MVEGPLLYPDDSDQYPHDMKIYSANWDGNEGWASSILVNG